MDEDLTHLLRSLAATSAVHQFILDYLLTHVFADIPKPARLALAKAMLDASENLDRFPTIPGDDLWAANRAEIVVLYRELIDHAVGRALRTAEEAEGSY